MKLIRVTFLLCAMAFLLLTPTSSLQLHSRYSSPSQAGVSDKIVIKMAPRKLMMVSSEHVKVMTSGAHEGSSKQVRVTSSPAGKSKNEEKRLGEDEEEKALSKYLSMDYPKFRRRRPVHNKSLPLSESRP